MSILIKLNLLYLYHISKFSKILYLFHCYEKFEFRKFLSCRQRWVEWSRVVSRLRRRTKSSPNSDGPGRDTSLLFTFNPIKTKKESQKSGILLQGFDKSWKTLNKCCIKISWTWSKVIGNRVEIRTGNQLCCNLCTSDQDHHDDWNCKA